MAHADRPEHLISLLETAVLQAAAGIKTRREALARRMGQTMTRWQLLSEASVGTRTVPQLARRLGLARQSVQRTADQLTAEGLARYSPNPDHVRSPHLVLTRRGEAVLAVLSEGLRREQVERGAGLTEVSLKQATTALSGLSANPK